MATQRNSNTGHPDVGAALAKLLADTYVLYIKTHGFHWNVTGQDFYQLHKLFEEQYNDLFEAADELAERLRAIGFVAPGSFAQMQDLSSLKEQTGVPKAERMIAELLEGHRALSQQATTLNDLAEKHDDPTTADLAHTRIQEHDKQAWMLDSLLKR